MTGEANESGSVDSGSLHKGGARWSLSRRLGVLVLVEVVLAVVVFAVAYLAGMDLLLVSVAWLVCFVGAIAAHVASEYPRGVEFVVLRMASGMACRMLLPIGFAVWGKKFSDPPIEAPIVFVLALFFLAGLAADSYLGLMRLKREGGQG